MKHEDDALLSDDRPDGEIAAWFDRPKAPKISSRPPPRPSAPPPDVDPLGDEVADGWFR
jgi:hypothetical protein